MVVTSEFNGNLTAAVKSVILRAWRERWTEEQWSAAMQSYLVYVDSCDSFSLSNILLEQAMISSSPNVQILDYLKHALFSNMTTFSSVIKNIVVYDDINQTFCVLTLLKFIYDVFGHVINFNPPNVDPTQTPESWLHLVLWLYTIITKTLQKLSTESKFSIDSASKILKMATALVEKVMGKMCKAFVALGLILVDNSNQKLESLTNEIARLLTAPANQNLSEDLKDAIGGCVKFDFSLDPPTGPPLIVDFTRQTQNICINTLITMEAYLFPGGDLQMTFDKLVALESLQGIPRPNLYCEIMRASYIGVMDADVIPEDIKWSAFIYIKIPLLFQKLQTSPNNNNCRSIDDNHHQTELYQGLNLLLSGGTCLLDNVDHKCSSDALQSLLNEFLKYSLISEVQSKDIVSRRQRESLSSSSCSPTTQSNAKESTYLILRAEPTVTTILKSLDVTKNQDLILSVMTQMMSGKSLELISAAAGATGKLQNFVMKLILINEVSKVSLTGETVKNSQTRAALFDISFLMLCHIVQYYGLEIISTCPDSATSFFHQWSTRCLPNKLDQFKSTSLQVAFDPVKVEFLLGQLTSGAELKTSLTKWHEICQNIPQAMHEFLVAWELGAIDDDVIKQVLETVKGTMSCLMVIVAVWLCSTFNIGNQERQQKCCKMLQQLLQQHNSVDGNVINNCVERSQLSREFISYITHLTLPTSTFVNISNHNVNMLPQHSQQQHPQQQQQQQQYAHTSFVLKRKIQASHDLYRVFCDTINSVYRKNCMGVQELLVLQNIHKVASPQWFITCMLKEITKMEKPEDIDRMICLYHSLCHFDLRSLTICLIERVIPDFVMRSGGSLKSLIDPWGSGVAKWCVLNVATLFKMSRDNSNRDNNNNNNNNSNNNNKKRSWNDVMSEDDMEIPGKLKKDGNSQDSINKSNSTNNNNYNSTLELSDTFIFSDRQEMSSLDRPSSPTSSSSSSSSFLERLSRALSTLFQQFHAIITDCCICPQTNFVLTLVKETLKIDKETAQFILHNMPPSMVPSLMRFLHPDLDPHQIFTMIHHGNQTGKQMVAKALCTYVHYKCNN